jgi:hypothetical protein
VAAPARRGRIAEPRPAAEEPKTAADLLKAEDLSFAAEALSISVKDAFRQLGPAPAFVARPRDAIARPPLRRRPSGEETAGAFQVIKRIGLGSRLPLIGDADMEAVGNALHAVFSTADGGDDMALGLGRKFDPLPLEGFEVQAAAIAAADRLDVHIRQRSPAARSRVRLRCPRGSTARSGRAASTSSSRTKAATSWSTTNRIPARKPSSRSARPGTARSSRSTPRRSRRRPAGAARSSNIHMALTGAQLRRMAPSFGFAQRSSSPAVWRIVGSSARWKRR